MSSSSLPSCSMPLDVDAGQLARAREWLAQADGILLTAGAGMGVDSGLPDFRGDAGFWRAYPALGHMRMSFTDIANGAAFDDDPARGWGFYGHRLDLYRATTPHAGFELLRTLAVTKPEGMFVYTSNVDGQFQKAGVDERRIVECHGSIHTLQCSQNCIGDIWPADTLQPQVDMTQCRLTSPLPLCPHCGAVARPNILMFNDWHWSEQSLTRQSNRLRAWLAQVRRPVVIELGAGTAIPSVRRMGESLNAPLIRINPREAHTSDARHIGLSCGALQGLQWLTTPAASLTPA